MKAFVCKLLIALFAGLASAQSRPYSHHYDAIADVVSEKIPLIDLCAGIRGGLNTGKWMGYLCWDSDGRYEPANQDDGSRGTLQGDRYESGLDNSPMYDSTSYDQSNRSWSWRMLG